MSKLTSIPPSMHRRFGIAALTSVALLCAPAHAQSNSIQPAFTTRDISWENEGATLVGTLYVPAGTGPFPTVVLIHASGRSTRKDWPYVTHAELFARNGIAALVYDKRGTGQSTGAFDRFPNMNQLAADALGGLTAIKSVREVDATRLGIWGRSQGAWVVAIVAGMSDDVQFAIPVAGGSVQPIEQEVFVQSNWLRKGAATADQIAQAADVSRLVWSYYATGEGRWAAQKALDALLSSAWFPALAGNVSGYPRSGQLEPVDWVTQQRTTSLRWQAGLLFDPARLWENISIPVLGLFGADDEVTPTEASVAALQQALQRGGNRRSTVRVFPGTAHSLCASLPREALVDGCSPVREYQDLLVGWIRGLPNAR